MEKPEFLYHGSQYYFETLTPQQANGQNALESQAAVYAASKMEYIIPFALPIRWYPDDPSGKRDFECYDGRTKIIYGSLDPDGYGFIYKLKSDDFEKIDEWQWIARREVVPVEIIKIKVSDYMDTIEFSDEAREINCKIYGTYKK